MENMWSAINSSIVLRDCEVFSYEPDMESDPFSEGCLWSFNYFFFNKSLKKILYFTCVAERSSDDMVGSDIEDDGAPTGTQEEDGYMFEPDMFESEG